MQEAAAKSLMYKLEVVIVHNSQELRITDFFCVFGLFVTYNVFLSYVSKTSSYSATEHLPLHNSL